MTVEATSGHLTVLISHAGFQAGADMGVAPHVHGLLLAPHEFGVGVAPQLSLHQIKGEGAQLQHTTLHVSCTMVVPRGGGRPSRCHAQVWGGC